MDAGEDARSVQYSIVRGRAPGGLPWAYGGTSATVSRYVEPTQSEPPVGRERVRARVLNGGRGMEASSSSSQGMSAGTSEGRTGRRRVSGADKGEALLRRAFDPDTLTPLAEYAKSSSFEDSSDRRTASDKCDWWGQYLAERKLRRMDVPETFEARLDRYRSIRASTEKRRQQADSRRDARVAAKEAVVDLVSDRSEMGEDDRAFSSATGIGRIEESKRRKRKRRGGVRKGGAASKSREREVREEADRDAEEELAMDYEVDEARARDHTVDSPRTMALQVEEILVGLRENLSKDINRLRRLIDSVPSGRREKPKGKH